MRGFDDVNTTHQALAAFGLPAPPPPPPEHQDIWPENLFAFNVFYRLRTQWSVGMGGLVGLRYEAISLAMELEAVPKDQWPEVMDGVQIMESETLRIARDKK